MSLGDRMKLYERREAGRRAMPLLPICARIDGKRFSRWTDGLARPYDERLSALMQQVTTQLVGETQAVIGYTQSDEISLVFHTTTLAAQPFMDGRIQKLTSTLASMTTAWFNAGVAERLPERRDQPALFDCRVWTVPNPEEAANTLLWRERDATKNAISMAARHYYTHDEVMGCSSGQQQELLFRAGVNFNDYPPFFKRGCFVQRREVQRPFSAEEIELLPPQHAARRDPDLMVSRSHVERIDMPPFDQVINRVAVVFEGAEPQVAQSSD
ncbi:tRNA(His) guanylyltransferase Thg1 family protein [Enhygromyxa salina]|uniref:tRNAHis guanylyltransferase n=1 Tax=Enhygromyxa salina TaxID=215803 RepID=A0A2S9YVN3_9BACT|nr:tRNA(His) guanylyltransferase Thg1 family protein [Enhygromyxa salina]PRQ09102.1 tRNAHis guanylyltransferase [Enhygromyxa salina]